MKILYTHISADLYGSSRSLLQLVRSRVRAGDEVLVVLAETGPLCGELSSAGAEYAVLRNLPVLHRSRLSGPSGIFRLVKDLFTSLRQIRKIVKPFAPDVMHTNTATVFLVCGLTARLERRPHIQQVRESFQEFGGLWRIYRRCLFHLSDRLVCISHWTASQFPGGMQKRISVIYNGISNEEIYPLPEEEVTAFRSKWSAGGTCLVGLLGRIKIPRKGQDVFLRAACRLHLEHPEVRFLIIGSPFPGNESHETILRDYVLENGLQETVIFCGELPNNPALNALDILVMASGTPEPFGRVTVEAMALGKPVVGTRTGGTPELMGENNPLLFEPGDDQGLADHLCSLIQSPQARLEAGQQGLERFTNGFTMELFLESMDAVYSELVPLSNSA